MEGEGVGARFSTEQEDAGVGQRRREAAVVRQLKGRGWSMR